MMKILPFFISVKRKWPCGVRVEVEVVTSWSSPVSLLFEVV